MSAQSVLSPRSVRSAPVPPDGADHTGVVRMLGILGVGAGLLFGAMSVWQHAAGFGSGAPGFAGAANQAGFALAMAGYVGVGVALHLARPGGDRAARVFPALIALAWTALLAGLAVGFLTTIGEDENLLLPIGGLAQGIGLTGLGITTVVARRWSGWRRFWALGFAVFFVGGLFVPAIAGSDPGVLAEVALALGYSGLGVALIGSRTGGRPVSVLMGVAVAALLGSATVVAFASGPQDAPPPVAPAVGDRPIHGSADVLERQLESGPRYGSADELERQLESVPRLGSADVLERQAESD